jgi:hypothetical protein
MIIDDAISELIGAIANAVVANGGGKIKLSELADILNRIGIETSEGADYTRPDGLVRKAYIYHQGKKGSQTAQNIKDVFVREDDSPVIRD